MEARINAVLTVVGCLVSNLLIAGSALRAQAYYRVLVAELARKSGWFHHHRFDPN
jgi:hypothetical protein